MKKYLLVLFIVLVFGSLAFGQTITLDYIGMHGFGGTSDFDAGPNEEITVRVKYDATPASSFMGINGVRYVNSANNHKIGVFWYDNADPASGTRIGGSTVTVSGDLDFTTGSDQVNDFTFTLPTAAGGALSFQIVFLIYGDDIIMTEVTSSMYTSYITDVWSPPSENPPSGWQKYMTYTNDTSTQAPTLDLPLDNATVGEDFTVQYDQPETAYSSTVKLTFTRTAGTADPNSPHILEVTSEASGTDKTLAIDGSNLAGSPGISSVSGGNVLVDDAIYTIKIEYQDLAQNPVASDQNAGITYDGSAALQASGGDYNAGTSFSPGSQDNAFFRLKMENTGSGTKYIDKIKIHMLGTFDASDIDLIEIWRSNNDSFGSDTSIGSGNPDVADEIEFDINEGISSSSPTWYFFTIDVDSGASGTDEIGLEIEVGGITPEAGVTVVGLPISGSTHPLPVTLSSFTVVLSGQPVIYWTTQSETNNAYWNIYRSISQNLGQAIQINYGDLIPGQGTVTEPTDYSYTDNYPIVENTTYWYWLECVDNAGEADILGPVSLFVPEGNGNNGTPATPDDYGLKQNYPNPFNPDTKINFALFEDSPVRLTIYNIKGEKIKTIFEDFVPADMVQTAYWDGKDGSGKRVASGVYMYRLRTNKTEYNKKMLLMK